MSAALAPLPELPSFAASGTRSCGAATPGSGLRLVPVQDRAGIEAFLDLPEQLYRDDPHWVPPLRTALAWRLRRALGQSHQLFLALRGAVVVGRISLLRDRVHEQHRAERPAFFGFFDCVPEPEVARLLLDGAAEAARAFGATSLRGPRNFGRVEPVGVLVEGFAGPAPMLAGHHGPAIGPLLEELGLRKRYDVLAFEIELYQPDGQPAPLPPRLAAQAAEVDIPGLEIRDAHPLGLRGDLVRAHTIFTEGFREVPENTPVPRAPFVAVGRAILAASDRRMLQIATVDGGQPAGFALCFPELGEALHASRGAGWLRLPQIAAALRRRHTASFKLIGLMPRFRGTGLHAALIARAIDGVRAAGYRRLEASLIDERNLPSRKMVESTGMQVYKRYRIYQRAL